MKTLKFKAPSGAIVEYQSYQKALVANGLYTAPVSASAALAKLKDAGFEALDAEPETEPEEGQKPGTPPAEHAQPKNEPAPLPLPVKGIDKKQPFAAPPAPKPEPEAAAVPEPAQTNPLAESETLAAIRALVGTPPPAPATDPELIRRIEQLEAETAQLHRLLKNLAGVLAVFYPESDES